MGDHSRLDARNPGRAGARPGRGCRLIRHHEVELRIAAEGRVQSWCMMWCMKRTNIYLAEGQADALDRVAQAAGVSRAELIRELIDRAIGGHPGADLVADLAAIDGSFGILAGEDTFARVRDERMNYLERLSDA